MRNTIGNNESLLIQSLKDGSQKAFDKIYQMYAKRLFAYSLQFTKSAEESEEIVHDVFVKLWINRQKIRQEDTLRSLLFIMTKHYLINAFRTKVNQPIYEEYVSYKEAKGVTFVGVSGDKYVFKLNSGRYYLKNTLSLPPNKGMKL